MDDADIERFPKTALPDAPEVATEAQQQTRLGQQDVLDLHPSRGKAIEELGEEIDEFGSRITIEAETLEKQFRKIEKEIDVELSRLDRGPDAAASKRVKDLEAELRRIEKRTAEIDVVGEEFGREVTPGTSRRARIEFESGVDEAAEEVGARAVRYPAERLDSIKTAALKALKDYGVDDLTAAEITDDYLARLVAAGADVDDMVDSVLGARRPRRDHPQTATKSH